MQLSRKVKKGTKTEAFADFDTNLPSQQGTHKLKIKVDIGAEGIFQNMFPHKFSNSGQPLPGAMHYESTDCI